MTKVSDADETIMSQHFLKQLKCPQMLLCVPPTSNIDAQTCLHFPCSAFVMSIVARVSRLVPASSATPTLLLAHRDEMIGRRAPSNATSR